MRLTQFTDYLLRVALYLAEDPGRVCSVREGARRYGISHQRLAKTAAGITLACRLKRTLGDAVRAFLAMFEGRALACAAALLIPFNGINKGAKP